MLFLFFVSMKNGDPPPPSYLNQTSNLRTESTATESLLSACSMNMGTVSALVQRKKKKKSERGVEKAKRFVFFLRPPPPSGWKEN